MADEATKKQIEEGSVYIDQLARDIMELGRKAMMEMTVKGITFPVAHSIQAMAVARAGVMMQMSALQVQMNPKVPTLDEYSQSIELQYSFALTELYTQVTQKSLENLQTQTKIEE